MHGIAVSEIVLEWAIYPNEKIKNQFGRGLDFTCKNGLSHIKSYISALSQNKQTFLHSIIVNKMVLENTFYTVKTAKIRFRPGLFLPINFS